MVCGACSNRRFVLPNQSDKPVRVCTGCYNTLSGSKNDNQLVYVTYVEVHILTVMIYLRYYAYTYANIIMVILCAVTLLLDLLH